MAEATFFAESEVQVTSSEVCILGRSFAIKEVEQVRIVRSLRVMLGYVFWLLGIVSEVVVGLITWFRFNTGLLYGIDNPLVPILSFIVWMGVAIIGGTILASGPMTLKISGRFGKVELECGNPQYGMRLIKAIKSAVAAYDTRLEYKSVVA